MALFIVAKLSAGPREIADWDAQDCRRIINLELHLSPVANKLQKAMSRNGNVDVTSLSMFHVLPEVLKSARGSFATINKDSHGLRAGQRVHLIYASLERANLLLLDLRNWLRVMMISQIPNLDLWWTTSEISCYSDAGKPSIGLRLGRKLAWCECARHYRHE